MTPKERAVAALTLKQPDRVPTFELEFYLEKEMFGKDFRGEDLSVENLKMMSLKEKEQRLHKLAKDMIEVFGSLEYSIFPIVSPGDYDSCGPTDYPEETKLVVKYMREMIGDNYMLTLHGDGTLAIPDGDNMYAFAYAIADDPEGMHEKARKKAEQAIEKNKRAAEMGIDCVKLCDDYCYNSGPYLSPAMFEEYIQPYLYRIIDEAKKCGLYTIKHTDGNIMPILNQLVECKPHALHSIDPMAKVDIREVKQLVGDKVALCGNVNCALMQTGTDEEVIESARYCLTHAKPGGGYIFSTSNVPFKGLPPERYKLILDVWKEMREY